MAKKKQSFSDWMKQEGYGISQKQAEEDERKRQAYLASQKRDDDIAPVKQTSSSVKTHGGAGGSFGDATDEKEDTWLKKSEGNWWQTILGSGTDLTEHVTAGAIGVGEKIVDALATVGTLIGQSSLSQTASDEMLYNAIHGKEDENVLEKYEGAKKEIEEKSAEFIAKDLYDEEAIAKTIISDPMRRKLGVNSEGHSIFGEKSDELAMSAGQLGVQLGVNALMPGSGIAVMGASTFGSEAESAFKNGATFGDAVLSASISTAAEVLTERLGGISFGGKTVTDSVFGELSSRVTGKFARALVSAGKLATDASFEAAEEVVSGYISAWGQTISYMDDKEIEELFSKEDALDAAIGGFVLGGGFSVGEAAITGRDPASGLTKNEQAVVDKEVERRVAEQEKGGKKLNAKEVGAIVKQVQDDMEHGQLDIEMIEEVLGGDSYTAFKDTVESEDGLKAEYEQLANIKKSDLTTKQEERLAELKAMNLGDTTKRDDLRKKLNETVFPQLKDSKLAESYNQIAKKGEAFKADLSKYKGKQREAVERAMKSGVLNDTFRSHELVDILSKIEAERGIVFDYTNNAKLKESGFALEGKTVNGFANRKQGSVTLNVQSAKAWQSVVGHEITHVLEGTEHYEALRSALYAYAESRGELESRKASLTELYDGLDADIDSELTADLVGDYLFTDKNFVNKLAGNRTLFQKVYDEIKYLWNVATGKEKTEIEKVKDEFDRVWKEYGKEKVQESESQEYSDADLAYSIREEAPPKETGIAYKVFFVKDGKLYPPMVANPDGADTPIGVWLNADVGVSAPPSKTGRAQVKAGGKGTQGGSGSLAFRPGWHLGDLPRASQFDRVNPETGKKELFPENFVWAEVEYAKDVDYQEEAMSYGYTENGKFRHAYAGLPRLPENGYYRYRTNPKPDTVPWVITGAMKVNRLLSDAEVNAILEENGVPAVHRQGGDVGLDKFGFDESGKAQYSLDKYTQKQYNNFGWARDTGAITKNELDDLYSKAQEKRSLKKFSQSADGEAIIEVNDDPHANLKVNNVFAFVKGTVNEPEITRVVRVNAFDEESLADFRKDIYGSTSKRALEAYARIVGEEFVQYYDRSSIANYGEYTQRTGSQQSGSESERNTGVDRNGNPRRITFAEAEINETTSNKETSSDDGVFFDGENAQFSLSSDNEGNQLSKEQQEFFKDSKVVDGKGRLKVVYHGTTAEFNIFKRGDIGFHFGNKTTARTRVGRGKNARLIESYINITNPIEFNEDLGSWDADYRLGKELLDMGVITPEEYRAVVRTDSGYMRSSGDANKKLRELLLSKGYDGITYPNNFESNGSTSYIVFGSNQVKLTTNANPTADPDIRFSISPDTDADYMSAVERGDTETAQRMVDEAAKAAGYTRKLYHGTASKFNVFGFGRTGIFTTDNFDMAKTYGDNVMSLYGKEGAKVLHIDAKESPHWSIEVSKDVLDFSEYPLMRGKDRYSTNDISLIAFREGYDVVVIDNVYDNYSAASGNTENGLGTDVVYKDPNQVKSSEAITYDDNGNVIPLSQRFNADNNDIRKSISKKDESYAPVGNYSTPFRELALEDDIAPVAPTKATEAPSLADIPVLPDDELEDGTYAAIRPGKEKPVAPKSERIADGSRSDELLYDSLDNYPMQTIEQKIAEKIRAIQGEIADKQDLRKESWDDYESRIAELRAKYNSKKNKNTKEARGILESIARQERLKASREAEFAQRISDLEARVEKMSDPKYGVAMQKRAKMEADAKWAADLLGDTSTWVDKKIGLQYATNTERRNLRDIVRDENGNVDIAKADAIDDALNGQYNRDEAAKKRELAKVRDKYAKLKITRAEDAYIQMLGEFRHNPDTTLTEEGIKEYYEKHKSKIDTEKVDKIIEMARQDYDSWLNRVNAELKKQGMKEIPYRQGYFPHFTEPKQNFIQKLLNWKTQDNEIPTSIAGLTETFKPTKSWQSFDKTRHSDETDYSFMKGFDSYSEGALDWIYHMDTLQKRRAVENHIRYTHSDEGISERIKQVYANEEYDANEAQAQIDHILSEAKNPLNNFVQDFTTHTNILAGKKNSLDRTVEQATNRHIYSVMTNVQNRMSANMVLANVRSALTNFIPITQSWAQVSPLRSLQAAKDTIANAIKDDGMINKSTFLTNRLREADKLYQTGWDKVLDKAGIMFEIVDSFSSQVIWRSKYNQNLANGMSEREAIKNADQFAENAMAGRSKGNEPTLFNAKNPLVKAFTMFQLEVNNQYGYLFKDVPNDLKAETKHWQLNLAKGYTTAFIGAYVYNALLEKVTGSDAALDPIGIIEELLRDLGLFGDDEEEELTDTALNFIGNVAEELPFVGGVLGGGRIPISSAIPYGGEYGGGLTGFVEDVSEGNWGNIGKEMMSPILNVGLPVGGGQLKKTVQGLKMFSDDHPVTGSYTDSGNLRFPVEDTPLNRAQAAVFGQYASKNAREYFDNDYAPLKEKQIQEYKDVDIPIKDYWEYREGLAKQDTLEDKFDYIAGLDLPVEKKNILINNVVDRKEKVDLEGYEDFGSLEEFDFAAKNPEKYAFAKSVGGYSSYKTYSSALYDIKADKDANGKTINGSRKEKVLQYINNLNADFETKIILFKSEYPSDDTYNRDIVNYLNNRSDLTYEERVAILTELGFRVVNGQIYVD